MKLSNKNNSIKLGKPTSVQRCVNYAHTITNKEGDNVSYSDVYKIQENILNQEQNPLKKQPLQFPNYSFFK
jgi:hypothetical protein